MVHRRRGSSSGPNKEVGCCVSIRPKPKQTWLCWGDVEGGKGSVAVVVVISKIKYNKTKGRNDINNVDSMNVFCTGANTQ